MAEQTGWDGIGSSTSGLRTHRLRAVGSERMVFRRTVAVSALALAFLLLPIGGSAYLFVNAPLDVWFWGSLLGCSPWALIGVMMLRSNRESLVFCKRLGQFWRGGSRPAEGLRLAEIHALQILAVDHFPDDGKRWTSYELNIVRHDASRVNVLAQGHLAWTQVDARNLGRFLDVPVWDESGG
ncbi:MAG: hypothetical protein IPM29_08295 [Planctomycetes bacterium]|nr:hypothetical protein [Planctomycetota bacterium]